MTGWPLGGARATPGSRRHERAEGSAGQDPRHPRLDVGCDHEPDPGRPSLHCNPANGQPWPRLSVVPRRHPRLPALHAPATTGPMTCPRPAGQSGTTCWTGSYRRTRPRRARSATPHPAAGSGRGHDPDHSGPGCPRHAAPNGVAGRLRLASLTRRADPAHRLAARIWALSPATASLTSPAQRIR